jgi:ribosomal protein L11 methyltransferase
LIKRAILTLFERHHIRLTPLDLERVVGRSDPRFSSRAIRSAIKEMVADGTLSYTNHFNTTHLELNFSKSVRVSPRIMLAPHGRSGPPMVDGLRPILLHQGSAFGIGDHPTTRLALCAVDRVMADAMAADVTGKIHALDIGTGSGVLAIAAASLGAEKVVALDIDPLAVHEARKNTRLNRMERVIEVSDAAIESLADKSFNLVMANLRPPTLRQIMPRIEALSLKNAYWVFSGFRPEDMQEVARLLPLGCVTILSRDAVSGWAAVSVRYCRQAVHQRKP